MQMSLEDFYRAFWVSFTKHLIRIERSKGLKLEVQSDSQLYVLNTDTDTSYTVTNDLSLGAEKGSPRITLRGLTKKGSKISYTLSPNYRPEDAADDVSSYLHKFMM